MSELPHGFDEVAVERALEGDTAVSLTAEELEYCWRELEAEEKSASDIADILGVTRRTVVRWRGGMAVAARPGKRSTLVDLQPDQPVPPKPLPAHELIDAGKQSKANRTRAVAERVERDLNTLAALLADEAERAKALAEVRDLEAKLAAAKERLRPGTAGHQKKRGGASSLSRHRPQGCTRVGDRQRSHGARSGRCLESPHRAVPRGTSQRVRSREIQRRPACATMIVAVRPLSTDQGTDNTL